MPLALLAAALLRQKDPLRKEAQTWLVPLQTGLSRCGAAMVDLPGGAGVLSFDRPLMPSRLGDFGAVLNREYRFAGGAHLFLRRWSPEMSGPASVTQALRKWLAGLDDAARAKLAKGEAVGDLDPAARTLLTRFAFGSNASVGTRMLEGDSTYQVSLSATVVANVRDPKTRKVNALPLPNQAFRLDPPANRVNEPLPELPKADPASPEKAEGPIDFGKGVVTTLAEAVGQATGQGGTPYEYDRRLGKSYVFLKGRFTPEGFLAALQSVGTVQSPNAAFPKGKVSLDDLARSFSKLDENMPQEVRDLLQRNGETPLEQVMGQTSALSGFFENFHLPPDDTLRLQIVPTLWITGSGGVTLPGSWATMNGKPVPVLTANQVGMVLDP